MLPAEWTIEFLWLLTIIIMLVMCPYTHFVQLLYCSFYMPDDTEHISKVCLNGILFNYIPTLKKYNIVVNKQSQNLQICAFISFGIHLGKHPAKYERVVITL